MNHNNRDSLANQGGNDKYSREELLANAEALFNVKQEVLHGAWYGDEQPAYSIDELNTLIKEFMKRRVN